MSDLTLGSLFDGSGGFPLGGIIAGITPVWASEVEPFPIMVTKKRLPFMKHLGDITAMDGGSIDPVDIITFGSPCQDMSVAGKRAGLDGERSNLFYQAVRIIKEMRCATDGKYPRFIVWENVNGAFSSNKGEDFRCVLESICRIKDEGIHIPRPSKWPNAGEIVGDGFSLAWRQFDAQYWGVPQRRKRIYLVADLDGGSAGKILFESEGLSGYSAEGFRSWEETAGYSGERTEETGCYGVDGYNSAMDDVAATLGVNCGMSTGRNGLLVLNDQGGERMDVTEDKTTTLRAEAHHPPLVMEAAGFSTEHSAKSRSIGYGEEVSPTLRAGVVPAAVSLEHNPSDGRLKIMKNDISQTLTSRMGTGGNNVPLLLKIRCGCEGGGKGPLIQKDKSATLSCNNDQTLFEPKVYGICAKGSNSMMSDNPDSGFYEAKTTRCLDGNGGNPSCNQGGMAVVALEGNGTRPSHHGDGYKETDTMYTLNATETHAVAFDEKAVSISAMDGPKGPSSQMLSNPESNFVAEPAFGLDRASFNQGKNAKFGFLVEEEVEPTVIARGPGAVAHPVYSTSKNSYHTEAEKDLANTLVATDYKDPPLINDTDGTDYIVRRLTPTECARLQGFPDWWCDDLATEHPSSEEVYEWHKIFETHRNITGTSSKPKTEKQIRAFLKAPHSDSAEYKMWGNGVALPCVYFVLSGIVWAVKEEL